MVKHYLVKYTIRDGEFEYGDLSVITTDRDISKLPIDEMQTDLIGDIFNYEDIDEDEEVIYQPSSLNPKWFENNQDYRMAKIDSYQLIEPEDLPILQKYGVL